ncbi:HNH endonuclease [Enterobacter soli]|nr:HNH endonuclease [Enterobacter soli]
MLKDPSKEDLEKYFHCDPHAGCIARLVDSSTAKAGENPIHVNNCGYHMVSALGKVIGLHRIMWIVDKGFIPDGMEIDHINGDKGDNRISNLRLCTPTENRQNKPRYKNNRSGFKGVYFDGRNPMTPWRAQIYVNKKKINLGTFHSAEAASHSYQVAAKIHFGDFASF